MLLDDLVSRSQPSFLHYQLRQNHATSVLHRDPLPLASLDGFHPDLPAWNPDTTSHPFGIHQSDLQMYRITQEYREHQLVEAAGLPSTIKQNKFPQLPSYRCVKHLQNRPHVSTVTERMLPG